MEPSDYTSRMEIIKAHRPPLYRLDEVINWELFRQTIESAFEITPCGPGGRPSFDKLMMFKILILQRYYNLSDDQTEFQITDRLSFMDFLGLTLADKVPDAKTIWHFKEQLKKKKLADKLFDQFTEDLEAKNIISKSGTLVDATFIEVPKQHNSKEDNKTIKAGKVPESFKKSSAKSAQKDTDARWAMKNKQTHFGYKNHVKSDQATKLITNYRVTAANVHDSVEIKALLDEKDQVVYADSAYRSQDIEETLKARGCTSEIHEKAYRNNPLTEEQKASNKAKSKVRARAEHLFGFMKNSMNRAMYMTQIGMARIKSCTGLINLTYNLCRYEQLVRLKMI